MTGVIAARAKQMDVTYEAMEKTYLERVSLRRMVTAGDVAATVAYLLSPAGRNISGQIDRGGRQCRSAVTRSRRKRKSSGESGEQSSGYRIGLRRPRLGDQFRPRGCEVALWDQDPQAPEQSARLRRASSCRTSRLTIF